MINNNLNKVLFLVAGFIISFLELSAQTIDYAAIRRSPEWKRQFLEIQNFKECFQLDDSKSSKLVTTAWLTQKLTAYISTETTTLENTSPTGTLPQNEEYTKIPTEILSREVRFAKDNLYLLIRKRCTTCKDPTEHYEYIIIPLKDLKTVSWTGNNLEFEAFSDSIKINNFYTNLYVLPFDFDKETDIAVRLKKAFVHLASFYWKPVNNEPF